MSDAPDFNALDYLVGAIRQGGIYTTRADRLLVCDGYLYLRRENDARRTALLAAADALDVAAGAIRDADVMDISYDTIDAAAKAREAAT